MKLHKFIFVTLTYFCCHEFVLVKSGSDYYDALGLQKGASDQQIKKAFRKLATQFHPDKNKDKDAEDKFREIAQAYEVLSDPEKKKKYDMFGESAFDSSGGGGSGSFHFGSFDDLFKQFHEPFGDGNSFQFSFGGNDFDDDEGGSFGFDFGDPFGDHFGAGDSFFGTHFGHENSHFQESHQQQFRRSHNGFSESRSHSSGRSCRTVTQRVGNMVTTYTQCS